MSAPLVVITGTSKGLGKALAIEMEKAGCTVVGCSRHPLEHPNHFQVDCSKLSEVQAFCEEVTKEFGPPTHLIHSAAVINTPAKSWELDPNEVHTLIHSNLLSYFYLVKTFIPAMLSAHQGLFITMSTEWGRQGEPSVAPYCASKFAIEGWTQALAKELPSPLAAMTLDPKGGFQTDMLQKGRPEVYQFGTKPSSWAKIAAPYILSLSRKENGKALTCPPTS